MQGLKKKRRVQIILLTIVALVVATIMIGIAMKDGINYFRSPSEVVDAPPGPNETFRIGGLVEDGSLERGAGESVRFAVTDGAASVPVVFRGILPDLFGEGQGMDRPGLCHGPVAAAAVNEAVIVQCRGIASGCLHRSKGNGYVG